MLTTLCYYEDLDSLHAHITMRQVMAITPQCRTKLGLAMICKRSKVVKVNDITLSQDLGPLAIDVTMDGVLIVGFKVETWSNVNLMSMEKIN